MAAIPALFRRRTQRSLIDLIEDAMRDNPCDAPPVFLEASIMADDLERYTPTAEEPCSRR